ncbi:Ger(x)C family spore germination protein [Sporosarcina sp. 179-K 3D1 HS]|uniref:Ger(x)C family spore germination protein n=1 Tax=Sporosarcina sp. 179-K 3D1 HS TaxID=3232169 RepID=UPI0039A36E5A
MKKRRFFLFILPILLVSGCWDEEQYKDVTIVPLVGLEAQSEGVKSMYAFPIFLNGKITYAQSEGEGLSTRASRSDANHSSMEGLDLAHLEVVLLDGELAKKELYTYIDMFFRTPRHRLGSYIAIIEGEMKDYFNPTGVEGEVSDYYPELLRTGVIFNIIPDITLQGTATLLFDDQIDLSLPYIIIEEESGAPKLNGVALFSNHRYTGKTLSSKESMLANLMRKKKGKYTRLSYMWKKGEEESPITIDVSKVKRKWDITTKKIDASYTLEVNLEEFPHDQLDKKKTISEIESFLSKEIEKEFNEVIKKTQEAKSDIVGFGRHVHAFHRELWKKGDWQETYATLPIEVKVKVKVTRTGITN